MSAQSQVITIAEAHAICDSLLSASAAYVLGVESWRHAHAADYADPDSGRYRYNRTVEVRFYNCEDGVKFKAPTIGEVIEEVQAHYTPKPEPELVEIIDAAVGGL